MTLYALSRDFDLLASEADRRFQRWLTSFGLPALILALIIPFLQLVGLTPGGGVPLPPRYATLAPPRPVEPPAVKEEQPKPETKPETKTKPVEKPKVSQEVMKQRQQQKARERATKEINKTFGSIANLLSTPATSAVQPLASGATTTKPGLGGDSKVFEKSATSTSQGIGNVAPAQRTASGTGLGQRKTSEVSGPSGIGADPGKPGLSGDKPIAGRTLNELQEIFDRNKGAFYALYNRAMRDKPGMQGKVVVNLTIEPDGSVSRCELVSSELGDPDLERKIVLRVQQMNFGAKSVPRFTYPNYPIYFLPS